jgi:CheY-like chemotaxis protein
VPEEKPTLLVVEDDIDLAEILASYFRAHEYDVFTVNWGEDAVQACYRKSPDIVILDIRLPDIDGFEVARRLRTHARTQKIPIIFLTEKRERNNILQGLEVGGDDYLTKPFDIQELRLRVRNGLMRASQASLRHPITRLPMGALVDEKLSDCLETDDWGILLVTIQKLNEFRAEYGFAASDDLQKAISLIIQNAVQSQGSSYDFIGQLNPDDYLIINDPQMLPRIEHRIQARIEHSLDFFYPLKDLENLQPDSRLKVSFTRLESKDGPFQNVKLLKERLLSEREYL